jgi:hypothetical protein
MAVRRVVPNVQSEAVQESREFYGLLGFEEVMNHGWIMTLASRPVRRRRSASWPVTRPHQSLPI